MRSQRASAIGLVAFLAICYLRFQIGKQVTATTVGTWYQTLHKASFNPPDSVFAPAWIVLYSLMAIAGWRVWRHGSSREERHALLLFAIQLGLNLAWSILFFGFQHIDLALAEMLVLMVIVIWTTMLFWRIDRLAGILLVPYVLWLGFATVLTSFIWILN